MFVHTGSGSSPTAPPGFFDSPCWLCNQPVSREQQIVRLSVTNDDESDPRRLTLHKECARGVGNQLLAEVAAYDEGGG